jgi:hypothetical protein
MLRSRRHFMAGATIAVGLPALSGCARGADPAYTRIAAELRAPLPASAALADLVRYATLAPNGHNTQPWRFLARVGGISVVPDFSRRTPIVDPDDHHLWVSLGCAVENLLIAAAARGQAGAVAMREGAGGVDIELITAAPSEDGLFAAIPLRQSTRSTYESKAVSADSLTTLQASASDKSVDLRLFTSSPDRERILDFVVQGNTAQMDDPAFVAELLQWIRFDPDTAIAKADGTVLRLLRQPDAARLARAPPVLAGVSQAGRERQVRRARPFILRRRRVHRRRRNTRRLVPGGTQLPALRPARHRARPAPRAHQPADRSARRSDASSLNGSAWAVRVRTSSSGSATRPRCRCR